MKRNVGGTVVLGLASVVACGGDPGAGDEGEGDDIYVPSSGDEPSGGNDDVADGSGEDGSCPPEQLCNEACCDAAQTCVDGQCRPDCGTQEACGDLCCGEQEVCYVGQCIVPGAACSGAQCATSTGTECGADQVCDPDLGRCVPDFGDPTCAFEPEPGVFAPIPRFSWGVRKERPCVDGCQIAEVCNANDLCEPTWNHVAIAPDDFPEWHQVVMSPMVADLDGDCVPEIVFNTYRDSEYNADGILRAISGADGSKSWTLGDAAWRTDGSAHPAIGDLDGDGSPEIVIAGTNANLYAIEADGTPRWATQSHGFTVYSGAPAIANFDGVGPAEIAFGSTIYDALGNAVFSAPVGATGSNGSVGPLVCVADLDDDDRPELIAGGTVYTFTGTVGNDFAGELMWAGTPPDGYCGVADFDLDGAPEVVTVEAGMITVFDGREGTVLADIPIPGGGSGGPPNIADFDGDGGPDIGTAGGTRYVVVRFDGIDTMTQLWEAQTQDGSSQRTGSSVFDFDGDGRSEVIYGDEWYLRIYPGTEPSCPGQPACDGVMTDEEVLFIDINSSRTRSEYPIIADVDGDFKAEIVISSNNESGQGDIGDAGIEVFEDSLDNWVATSPIWNQHSYHITNVAVDGSIPTVEDDNWATYNSYRRNAQGDLPQLCAPDLVPSDLAIDADACPDLRISVKVVNQGCLGVGPGVAVTFYDGSQSIGTATTSVAIPAGGSTSVTLEVTDPGDAPFDLSAVVDDAGNGNGALNECREENNATAPQVVCLPIG